MRTQITRITRYTVLRINAQTRNIILDETILQYTPELALTAAQVADKEMPSAAAAYPIWRIVPAKISYRIPVDELPTPQAKPRPKTK